MGEESDKADLWLQFVIGNTALHHVSTVDSCQQTTAARRAVHMSVVEKAIKSLRSEASWESPIA